MEVFHVGVPCRQLGGTNGAVRAAPNQPTTVAQKEGMGGWHLLGSGQGLSGPGGPNDVSGILDRGRTQTLPTTPTDLFGSECST